jgi:hypothetical protein
MAPLIETDWNDKAFGLLQANPNRSESVPLRIIGSAGITTSRGHREKTGNKRRHSVRHFAFFWRYSV